jgi:hypothetical protein
MSESMVLALESILRILVSFIKEYSDLVHRGLPSLAEAAWNDECDVGRTSAHEQDAVSCYRVTKGDSD